MKSIQRCLLVEVSLFTSSAVIYQSLYSPRLLGKKIGAFLICPEGRGWLYTGYKFIYCDHFQGQYIHNR